MNSTDTIHPVLDEATPSLLPPADLSPAAVVTIDVGGTTTAPAIAKPSDRFPDTALIQPTPVEQPRSSATETSRSEGSPDAQPVEAVLRSNPPTPRRREHNPPAQPSPHRS